MIINKDYRRHLESWKHKAHEELLASYGFNETKISRKIKFRAMNPLAHGFIAFTKKEEQHE